LHSRATEGEKGKKVGKKGQFFSEWKKFKPLHSLWIDFTDVVLLFFRTY
jgi:hypothetical protein